MLYLASTYATVNETVFNKAEVYSRINIAF